MIPNIESLISKLFHIPTPQWKKEVKPLCIIGGEECRVESYKINYDTFHLVLITQYGGVASGSLTLKIYEGGSGREFITEKTCLRKDILDKVQQPSSPLADLYHQLQEQRME
ncbi:hypothetical protein HYX11_04945 [Candidatus Woesearchaeota archaeon]|nr:hypothetical protein [Candidatus Woesearchaeota archaeon]